MGVDVFFVISGYVVTSSLVTAQRESVMDYFLSFYARRVKRLAPALATMVALTTLATSAIVPSWLDIFQLRYYETALWTLVGGSNMYLAKHFDYFDLHLQRHSDYNPFLHTWSLAVEEQFYAIQPLLLLLGHGSSLVVTCCMRSSPKRIALVQVALTLASVALAYLWHNVAPDKAYYHLFTRFWELQAGVAFFHAQDSISEVGVFAVCIVELFTLLCLGTALGWSPPAEYIPWPWAAVSTIGTLGVLATGDLERSFMGRVLRLRPFVYIGSISYTIYLFHHPVFALTRWCGNIDDSTWAIGALSTSVLVAIFTSHLIEKPLMRWKPKYLMLAFVPPFLMLSFAALIILAVSGVSPFFGKLYGPTYHQQLCPEDHRVPPNYGNYNCTCQMATRTYHVPAGATHFEVGMPPCYDMCAPIVSNVSNCYFVESKRHPDNWREIMASCLTPDRSSSRHGRALFLLGDSHADSLAPGMQKAVAGVLAFAGWYRAGGFTTDGGYFNDPNANNMGAEVTRLLDRTVKSGDVVVTTCNSGYFTDASDYSNKAREGYVTYVEQLLKYITGPRGAHLLLLNDIPILRDAGYFCLPTKWKPEGNSPCPAQPRQRTIDMQAPLVKEWTRLAQQERVHFLDIHRLLCDDSECSIYIPGTPVPYTGDGSHVNADAQNYLWPFLCSFMKTAGLFSDV